jgi:uncharacterized surface protein with fasciclin (FAS1) repeats
MQRRFLLTGAPALLLTTGLVAGCAQDQGTPDIVDIASNDGRFTTLVAALQAADLVDTLKGPGPFTVFAPTDAAFAALPAGTVDTLLMPENKAQLASILTYHVVPGAITSDQVIGERLSVGTVQGSNVTVDGRTRKYGAAVRVNDANVTQADIIASNGVIHVIDKVLMP